MTREMHHEMWSGGILLPDKRSAKAKYGLHSPEYMDSSDRDFLREGELYLGNLGWAIFFQLTKPSPGIEMTDGYRVGEGFIVGEIREPWAEGFHEGSAHSSRIRWKK